MDFHSISLRIAAQGKSIDGLTDFTTNKGPNLHEIPIKFRVPYTFYNKGRGQKGVEFAFEAEKEFDFRKIEHAIKSANTKNAYMAELIIKPAEEYDNTETIDATTKISYSVKNGEINVEPWNYGRFLTFITDKILRP